MFKPALKRFARYRIVLVLVLVLVSCRVATNDSSRAALALVITHIFLELV